jgi:hypothetical protein
MNPIDGLGIFALDHDEASLCHPGHGAPNNTAWLCSRRPCRSEANANRIGRGTGHQCRAPFQFPYRFGTVTQLLDIFSFVSVLLRSAVLALNSLLFGGVGFLTIVHPTIGHGAMPRWTELPDRAPAACNQCPFHVQPAPVRISGGRNRFHRYFGGCLANIPAASSGSPGGSGQRGRSCAAHAASVAPSANAGS